jgi:hypothetical protein
MGREKGPHEVKVLVVPRGSSGDDTKIPGTEPLYSSDQGSLS